MARVRPKIAGITPSGNHDYALMAQAGIGWLRWGLGFPFGERPDRASERFRRRLREARRLRRIGFGLLGGTFGPGSFRYDPAKRDTVWRSGLPAWAGEPGSESYFAAVAEAARAVGTACRGVVALWQIANEPDIDIFRGSLTQDQVARFLLASARGVKAGDPSARTGINIGELSPYAAGLIERTYLVKDGPFDYIGLDGYFGSWQPGGPWSWQGYIDDAYRLTGRPVLINEWGYSSLGSAPPSEDLRRTRHYNQGVCRSRTWPRVWRSEHSPREQADYVRVAKRLFLDHPRVAGDFFFKWSDDPACWQCGQAACPAECAWGLVDVNGVPKPAWHALAGCRQ